MEGGSEGWIGVQDLQLAHMLVTSAKNIKTASFELVNELTNLVFEDRVSERLSVEICKLNKKTLAQGEVYKLQRVMRAVSNCLSQFPDSQMELKNMILDHRVVIEDDKVIFSLNGPAGTINVNTRKLLTQKNPIASTIKSQADIFHLENEHATQTVLKSEHEKPQHTGNEETKSESDSFHFENKQTSLKFENEKMKHAGNAEVWGKILDERKLSIEFPNNVKCPNTVLLYGPPGTGKTSAVSNLADELGALLTVVRCSDITDKFYGETAKNMRKLCFGEAEARYEKTGRLQIVLFDEIDLLVSEQISKSAGSTESSIKAELQISMDDLNYRKITGVLFIATTNNPSHLHKEVQRRFKKRIHVQMPSQETRESIIKSTLLKCSHGYVTDEVIKDVAKRCTGTNGRGGEVREMTHMEVVNMCELAMTYPARRAKKKGEKTAPNIEHKDFLKALIHADRLTSPADLKILQDYAQNKNQALTMESANGDSGMVFARPESGESCTYWAITHIGGLFAFLALIGIIATVFYVWGPQLHSTKIN